jgi:hypothetical protein
MSSNITLQMYLALRIITIHSIQYIINCIHFFVSSSLLEKNNLYIPIIHIAIPTIIIIGIITFTILVNTKLLILSHHHINEFGSDASKFHLIGSMALFIEESNLHILSTQKENFSELLFVFVPELVKLELYHHFLFTTHSISTVLCVCVNVLFNFKFQAIILVDGFTMKVFIFEDLKTSLFDCVSIQLINHSGISLLFCAISLQIFSIVMFILGSAKSDTVFHQSLKLMAEIVRSKSAFDILKNSNHMIDIINNLIIDFIFYFCF